MKLPTEVFDNVIVVHTPEELSSDTAEEFSSFLAGLEQRYVVLDLDHTETLFSKGLESFLDAHDRLCEEGGEVKIATTNPMNRTILEITRLDRRLDVFDNVLDAVKSFR